MPQELRQYYLTQMGIDVWLQRVAPDLQKELELLALKVSACMRCPLQASRTNTVFSRGNPNASLMIVGAAPGFEEDQQGVPFVGVSGRFLNKMLSSIGLSNENVYITKVLKCRHPGNATPSEDIISQCCDYLSQQIKLVAPKLILGLGHIAGQFLLNARLPIHDMRSKLHDINGIPAIISFDPAHLLQNPHDKKQAYSDLLYVKQCLDH